MGRGDAEQHKGGIRVFWMMLYKRHRTFGPWRVLLRQPGLPLDDPLHDLAHGRALAR